MPPFREGPIVVDRRFDGDALHELRDIGHGHRINIVDASYDIPRPNRIVDFPGSSADALRGVIRLIPIELNRVDLMSPDPQLPDDSRIATETFKRFQAVLRDSHDEGYPVLPNGLFRKTEDEDPGVLGFYDTANDQDEHRLYIRTIDELPFACATLVAGHSQLTE